MSNKVNTTLTATLQSQMPLTKALRVMALEASRDRVVTTANWSAEFCGAGGTLHGGYLMSLADGTGAVLAFLNLEPGATSTTSESKTNFFRPVTGGTVRASSTIVHKGRTTIVVQTDITSDDGAIVARTTQTQLVRAPRRLEVGETSSA